MKFAPRAEAEYALLQQLLPGGLWEHPLRDINDSDLCGSARREEGGLRVVKECDTYVLAIEPCRGTYTRARARDCTLPTLQCLA